MTDLAKAKVQVMAEWNARTPESFLETAKAFAQEMAEARDGRDSAIKEAHRRGLSLRAIAYATGLSHAGIAKILARTDIF